MDQENRTEKPTEKKRQEERKKGNIAKTMEFNSALILLFFFVLFSFLGAGMVNNIVLFMTRTFTALPVRQLSMGYIGAMSTEAFWVYARSVGPFLLCSALVGLIANIAQVKFVFSFSHLKQGFSKLNMITGMKKFFSINSWVTLAKNIFKAIIVSFVLYKLLEANIGEIFLLAGRDVYYISEKIIDLIFKLGSRVSLVILVIAIFDYIFQKKQHEKKIMMTKHEIKMEHRMQEGDPLFKSRRKSQHMQYTRLRMLKDVLDSDVVVTNPTEYAVALKYKAGYNAPRVLAKGIRLIAGRIKDIAKENDIPIVENVFVAQTVYKTCNIGDEIPSGLYKAVAEILAYVYGAKEEYSGMDAI
ncbi:MAG: hypothetical protein AVO38_15105 [delta proteobacterium ML8_D]|jgi:flagellar biosynthetic protein FlhB|nr:MAG: hypothetical protein AVO38_15105 [delta proteobacterium ML8_D]